MSGKPEGTPNHASDAGILFGAAQPNYLAKPFRDRFNSYNNFPKALIEAITLSKRLPKGVSSYSVVAGTVG